LHVYHASQFRTKVKSLKIQLRTPKKDRNVATYILDIKKIVDTLVAIESSISIEYHIEAIIYGLYDDYDNFVTYILTCTNPCIMEEIEFVLLFHEERLEKYKTIDFVIINNVIIFGSSNTYRNKVHQSYQRNNKSTNGNTSFIKNQHFNNIKNAPRSFWQQQKPQCQILNKFGHVVTNCWQKFEHDFQLSISANQS